MPNLSYSDDALNVRGAFLGAKAVVYVEGDDDVLFWQGVFAEIADDHFEVESVGGSSDLDERAGPRNSDSRISVNLAS